LHLGCGPHAQSSWLNLDARRARGVDVVADLRQGLPLRDRAFECAVAIHVLQDLPYLELEGALREIYRVLRSGGVLRLGLPDLERAIDAYRRHDARYFHVPDADARSIGRKLVAQIIWYGSVRTPFTYDFIAELLGDCGFWRVRRCAFGHTASALPELAALDNRPRESLFVEAERP
jgi:SAM-dependent methyltransferase